MLMGGQKIHAHLDGDASMIRISRAMAAATAAVMALAACSTGGTTTRFEDRDRPPLTETGKHPPQ